MAIYIKIIENGLLRKYIPGYNFREITLPRNIHSVDKYCFSPWSPKRIPLNDNDELEQWHKNFNVTQIVIPKNVRNISKLAFADMLNLKRFIVEDGCLAARTYQDVLLSKDGKQVICCPPAKRGELVLPDGVETVLENSFEYTKLSKVFLPNSVKVIEDDAFTNSELQNIYIPGTVEHIGERVFNECENLTILAPRGSIGLEYAKKHNIPFEDVIYISL